METTHQLSTGAHKSVVDARDWTLASVGAPTVYPVSREIDMSWATPSMQGKIGCCVGCTGEEVVRRMVYLATGQTEALSWRFVYAVAKCLDGIQDEGTSPAIVAKIIRKYGVPLAKFCPNDVSLDHESFVYNRNLANIPAEAFADALSRRSGADMTVTVSEEGIKQAINYAADNGGGVMILRSVGDTYWTDVNGNSTWDPNKILPIRVPKEFTSGHEEFLTKYDYEQGTGRMRIYWLNHWSDQWADKGRAWEYADVWLPHVAEMRAVVKAVPVVNTFTYHFSKSLKRGNQGPDVVALQHVLMLEDCFPTGQTFTGYFGDVTFAGVVALQQKYASIILTPNGLNHGTGFVGASTLAWLNSKYNK